MVWNLFRSRRSRKPIRSRPVHKRSRPKVECLEDRYLLNSYGWLGLDGNFNDGTRWQDTLGHTGVVPGPNDDATIGSSGFTVTIPAGDAASVNTLVDNARLIVANGGSLSLANVIDSSRVNQLVLNGTLHTTGGFTTLANGSAIAGNLDTAAGATLIFNGGTTHNLNAGASFTNNGTFQVAGLVSINVDLDAPPVMELANSGTLTGAATLTSSGAFNWTGGGMNGTGATVINGTLTISQGNGKFLGQRTLTTAGNTVITPNGTGTLDTGDGAVWTNQATIDDQADILIRYGFGTFPGLTLNNEGTLQKSAGSGTTDFQRVTVNNDGLLDVQTGTVQLDEGGASTGSFTMETGANLVFSRDTYTVNDGSSFSGDGVVTLAGGTVAVQGSVTAQNVNLAGGTLAGAGTLAVEGAFNWTAGGMSDVGTTLIDTSATLTISGGTSKFLDTRTLTTAGNTIIDPSGTGNLDTGDGAVWTNLATIDDQADILIRYAFGTFPALTLNNEGTLQKSAGSGTTDFQRVTVNNDGLLDVQTGTVQLDEGGASTGSFTMETGANLLFTRDTYTVNDGSSFSGDGVVTLAGGAVDVEAAIMAQNVNLAGGTLTGAGTLTVEGAFNWTAGGMNGAGTTLIDTSATLTISGGTSKFLGQRTLTTAGNTTITSNGTGLLDTGDGAVWNNQATIDDQVDILIRYGFGTFPALTLNNEGIFQKSGGSGTTDFQRVIVNNDSEFDILSGTVQLDEGGESTGTFNAVAGTVLQFSRDNYILNAGSNLPGAGLVQVTGGTLSVNANVSVANMAVIGGTLDITNNGILNVAGTYDQTSTLVIELSGTTPGAGYGQLNVGGTANISGDLTVVYDDDYQPNIGDSFRLVTFGGLNGSFRNLNLPGLASGRHWTNSYDASGFTLAVAAN